MATIYPSIPENGTPQSERVVFECLRDGLPDDWVVIHGQRFVLPRRRGRGRPDEGEVDFLVLDPARGLVALEVKGGGIAREREGWFSTDRTGVRHRIKDPGKQCQNSSHKLAHFLRDNDRSLADLAYGWGVVFPDVDANGGLGASLPRPLLIDRGDLNHPERSVGRVFEHSGVQGPALETTAIRAFKDILLPRFRLVPSLKKVSLGPATLAERIATEEEELIRLTEDQMRILDFNGHLTRLAVEGGAGTGKTLVALDQARRLAGDGSRVLVLCFNKALALGLANEVRDAEAIDVWSFHSLCHDKAVEAGLEFNPRGGGAEFWEATTAEILLEALEALPDDRYDAVIVDEGQDFADHWWIAVQMLLRDPEAGVLWVFHDPAQNIFGRKGWSGLSALQSAILPENCRNTRHIGQHAYGLLDREAQFLPGAPDGAEVEVQICGDEREMVDAVRKTLHRLIVEGGISPDRIAVLSAPTTHKSVVWSRRTFGNYELVPNPVTGPGQVGFATLQRFKGLEADVVILCEIMPGKKHSTPNHVYVGASRAKHALVVLRYAHSEQNPTSVSSLE